MESTVMKSPPTRNLLPILAVASLFIKICGATSPHPVLTGPSMAYVGSRVAFGCIAPGSTPPVTYKLMRDGDVLFNDTDYQGDQHVRLFLKVTSTLEGSYHCKATSGGSTGVSNSIRLSVVTPASNTRVTSEPFPPVAYEGSDVVLNCTVSKGSHLSYTWFFNRKEVTSSTLPLFHLTGNRLAMANVTPEYAGYYSCMSWSMVQDIRRFSSSEEVQVTVKAYVSKPKITFSISKEGDDYHGNVTCWSTRGSPPVIFSLLLDNREAGSVTVTDSLTAWFPVTVVPGLDMGVAQCRVNTKVQELMSEPVTLEVVPVGGNVKVEVEYLFRADSILAAAKLSCQVDRGTFPYISWLLNDSVLPSETHLDSHFQPVPYGLADRSRTLVVTKLGPEESGYYRCRARDSYDDSGPWVESAAVLVRVTDWILNSMPRATSPTETSPKVLISTIEAVTIGFCCFVLLMLALGVGFVYKIFSHKEAHARILATNPRSDAIALSEPTSPSGGKQADASSTDWDVQDQSIEIAV